MATGSARAISARSPQQARLLVPSDDLKGAADLRNFNSVLDVSNDCDRGNDNLWRRRRHAASEARGAELRRWANARTGSRSNRKPSSTANAEGA